MYLYETDENVLVNTFPLAHGVVVCVIKNHEISLTFSEPSFEPTIINVDAASLFVCVWEDTPHVILLHTNGVVNNNWTIRTPFTGVIGALVDVLDKNFRGMINERGFARFRSGKLLFGLYDESEDDVADTRVDPL